MEGLTGDKLVHAMYGECAKKIEAVRDEVRERLGTHPPVPSHP